jgi:outer membrane protein
VNLNDLKAGVCVSLLLLSTTVQAQQTTTAPAATSQQPSAVQQGSTPATPGVPSATQPAPPQPVQNDTTGTPGLPQAPQPMLTQPLFLRDTDKDYTRLKVHTWRNPFLPYTATDVPEPRLSNTPRLDDLLRDGKLYLSLSDAVTLALENNYDIAIARINLDIADADLLRAQAGSTLRGVSTGLVTNTLGGTSSTITGGGGPGGTTTSTGGSGTGASGLVLSTNGGGPLPFSFDGSLTGNIQYQQLTTQESTTVTTGTSQLQNDTVTANAGYTQGFAIGSQLTATFNNFRQTTNSTRSSFGPLLSTTFQLQYTQHLLQGFGPKINKRFILEAKNDRRITDSSFRQQLLYTVNQVESIYWSLVSAYEDEQDKERALVQSTQLASDNRKQLEFGTLAPLDVVNADSAVSTDKQALITSKSNLEYQQLLMKQAIARSLNDPQLANAPVVPTDRVSLEKLPEEDMKTEDLVKMAFVQNPQIEQAVLTLENNRITIMGEKNGLLPIIDAYALYGSTTIGGAQNPNEVCSIATTNPVTGVTTTTAAPCTSSDGGVNPLSYGAVLGHLFNGTAPNYEVGVNITVPVRNRVAQADQARSQMEYRQTEMRLQQLYTQIRIQVINGQYALTNDRANVIAAETARDYNAQSLDAEQKKLKLGASTTANVLQQQRNLATAEDNLISAQAAYAKDRASLRQILSNTLDLYGVSITDAATGTITQKPAVPGLTAPKPPDPPKPLVNTPPPPGL